MTKTALDYPDGPVRVCPLCNAIYSSRSWPQSACAMGYCPSSLTPKPPRPTPGQVPMSDFDGAGCEFLWVRRIWARFRRFWHCLWYTFADRERLHRSVTLVECNHQVPTMIDWLLPHRVDTLFCECGKVF